MDIIPQRYRAYNMESHQIDNLTITLNKTGARQFAKVSYPIRYGRYAEIKTPAYTYQFNLNHEIKYIQGHGNGWPSPSEWLKRTVGNDWVYYLAGDYSAQVPIGDVTTNVDETDPQFPLNHLQTEGTDPYTVTLLTAGGTVDLVPSTETLLDNFSDPASYAGECVAVPTK